MKEKTVRLPKEKQTVVVRFAVMVLSVLIILTSLSACGGGAPESSAPGSQPERTTTTTTTTTTQAEGTTTTTTEPLTTTTTTTTTTKPTTTTTKKPTVTMTEKPTSTTTAPTKEIPFTVKEVLYGDYGEGHGRDHWQILRSREELLATELDKKAFWKSEERRWYQIDFSAYPDAYFTDKTLLLLVVYNKGSNRNRADELLVNGELLIANYTEFQPPELIFEAIPCYLLLEVDRADVERVTTLKMQETLRKVSDEEMPD